MRKLISELKVAIGRFDWSDRQSLTDVELAYVAIRYNRGRFDWDRKLRQGYYSGGKYYGEWIAHYLELAKSVPMPKGSAGAGAAAAAFPEAANQRFTPSYYPHWVWRRGDITTSVMERLPEGTIIGVHHSWDEAAIAEILDYPGKSFAIAWYCESNLAETEDPVGASGVPIAARIDEARATQAALEKRYAKERFTNLVELDAARDKKLGNLDGAGNRPADWLADAKAVKAAGFRYLAKSPRPAHVAELRQKLGDDFVPRIVFEDVVNDEEYRGDAIALAKAGETVTLVIHEGGYDGDPGATLQQAKTLVRKHFAEDLMVEAFHGKPEDDDDAFERLRVFPGTSPVRGVATFDAATEVIRRARAIGAGAAEAIADAMQPAAVPLMPAVATFEPRLGPETRPVVMRALRNGMQGDLVRKWQSFLLGKGFDPGGLDGDFGDKTQEATRAFQQLHGLAADGVAGQQTLAKAISLGFELIEEPAADITGSNFPPRPSFPPLTGTAARQAVFGAFDYVPSPVAGNRERIRILGDWEDRNIILVPIPQLRKALGAGAPSGMRFHRLAAPQLVGLWAEWESEGLLGRIKSFDGAFVPRFIRGSQSVLSNHAFGSAFDINADTNGLGERPPLVGKPGSVRELVPIAHKWGFYWGGHFGSRPDGMHFEIAQILSPGG